MLNSTLFLVVQGVFSLASASREFLAGWFLEVSSTAILACQTTAASCSDEGQKLDRLLEELELLLE